MLGWENVITPGLDVSEDGAWSREAGGHHTRHEAEQEAAVHQAATTCTSQLLTLG